MLLSEIVSTSAGVAGTSGRKAKTDQIAALLARVPVDEVPVAVAFLSGDLTQRQIGVGYAALMGLPDSGSAWLGSPAQPATGQPAGLAEEVSEEEAHTAPASRASLTLTETDAAFGQIGALSGPGSQARRRELLASLVGRATESERQFLVRLIAGDLRQGALEGVMTDAVAKAAGAPAAEVRRAHQLRGSLAEVARAALGAAADGGTGDVVAALRAFTLRVGQPVRPMLAASAPSLEAALEKISPAALEWKIDGIRIQIHRDGERARVFTRTLDDITDRVPEIVTMARSLQVSSAVIDGEAVALRPDGRPHPFQVTAARAASQSSPGTAPARGAPRAGAVPLTAYLFDLLHVDGEDLIDVPESERFERLAAIGPPVALIPRLVTGDEAEAAEFFAGALARGHEGLVVKATGSPYGAGRRGGDWIKVKPRTTLDLVILAAEWGHGRRTGWLSNLHLGARDPETGGFVMLGKTFKGLTDAMLTWQTERLLALAEQPQAATPERPFGVVRVRPELVAEIAFDGVQASRRYPGGVALRFARVLRYREDKKAAEADTIDMVRALWPHAEEEG
ncbi:MAG TPA: ATP-dependent DNA ligase [Streptosporangiaceae bacterium]|nr:ATP-dependent DNA ligase [Streptosporangiaceae bacterium]